MYFACMRVELQVARLIKGRVMQRGQGRVVRWGVRDLPAICKEELDKILVLHALALNFFIEVLLNGVTQALRFYTGVGRLMLWRGRRDPGW